MSKLICWNQQNELHDAQICYRTRTKTCSWFPQKKPHFLQPLSWPVLDTYQCFECFDFFFKEMIGKIWENVWNLPKQFDFFSTLNSVEPGWTWMQDEHPVVASVCESCRFGRNDVIIRSCRAASMAVWGELKWHLQIIKRLCITRIKSTLVQHSVQALNKNQLQE